MVRTVIALAAVSFCLLGALAQDAPAPVLPKPARGFDEGRARLLREAGENRFEPGKLVERLFETADLAELAGFCARHLTPDERTRLEARLKLTGKLKGADAAAVRQAFAAAGLKPDALAAALGGVLQDMGLKLTDVTAWLYLRGFNFEVLQRAMNGERIDSIRLRSRLRAMADSGKGPDALVSAAFWEFNLKDGREEAGGHYDGVQFVEGLLALGWTEADFAAALARHLPKGLTERQKTLVRWGDAQLLWQALSQGLAESELHKAALDHLRATRKPGDAAVLAACLARARTLDRWFRTGGPGVVGVWTGPLPGSNGEPKPPTESAEALPRAGHEEFAAGLDDAIRRHFADARQDTLWIVAYADGSARMLVNRPSRAALAFGPDTPPGAPGTMQMYEGRFTLEGRIGYATLVFDRGLTLAPPEIDLVNLRALAGGALLSAQLDDGVTLTPMLLRRASRLADAP